MNDENRSAMIQVLGAIGYGEGQAYEEARAVCDRIVAADDEVRHDKPASAAHRARRV